MGIKGLLPALNGVEKNITIKDLKGLTIGIDAYVWLHRGSYCCVLEIFQNRRTTKYVDYCVRQIQYLEKFNIKPYFVFDGGLLPKKGGTEENRNNVRNENREKGFEYLKLGQTSKAYDCFKKSVDVTPYMAYQLIKELKKMKIDFVVAPYEADAQLAYLEKIGLIQAIITEDSDLLVFGCKRVIYKWTKEGTGSEISRDRFNMCRGINLIGWSDEMFRHMCILSGCDYLPNIPKVGIKRAYTLVKQKRYIKNILFEIKQRFDLSVPPDYEQQFIEADKTFLYQRVFDPIKNELVTLNPVPNDLNLEDMEYIGPELDKEIAIGIAKGDLNPLTKEPNSNELVDPYYKDLLKQMNSSESSNNTTKMNTSASFDELKTNKLYKPSQFKVTMNSNKVDFLTNASTTTNKSNSNSITDIINRRRRNNKSLFKKFQKTNETTISNVSNESGSLHIHEKINSNNITEITIIDDITNSSDVEIDVINSTKNFNTIDDDIINIVDDINALTNNKINNNMKPSNNDVNNDTDTLNANNNNIIDNDTPNTTDLDKSNSQTELFSPILAGNDDDDDVLPDAQSVLTINLSNNEQSHQHPASESQSSDKSVTIMSTTNCNNNKIKTLDSFFTKSISFSEYEKSIFSTSSSSLDKRENKTTNNKSNNNATKNNSSKNKTSSIPTNTISNYFISTNRKKQPTTPKFNKQHSYPTVTNQSNEDKMDNQFVNLRKLFNFSNNPEKVTSSSIEIKDSTLDHNNNENSSNDKPKTSNEIIIDDIQDSDIEEDPDEVKSVKDNKSIPESMEPEVGTNSTVTNEMATPSSLSEDGPNTKNLTKNESEVSSHQNAAKNKFKALLNRNNILLRKSASVSKTSTYFFKSSSSQNEENEKETSSSGTTESSNPQKGNMLVDEPTPLYISDSENENENDTINSDDDENESDKNNNSSSLNIFSSFIKSDNEDDILSEIDDNDLNKNNNDNNNDSNILSSSTIIPSSGYSLSNDDHTKINNNDDDDSSINFNATTNNTNPDSPSINISQMFDSFHTNNLKRKRDKYSTTPEDKNFFTEANKQETKEDSQSTVVASQNSTPPKEEVKVNDSHKNISLLLKQRFSYAKGVDSNSDSASQILTKSLVNSLPSYNLNSSTKASNAYVAPKMNKKKKNIKRKISSSKTSMSKNKEKENQKTQSNQLENSPFSQFVYSKY